MDPSKSPMSPEAFIAQITASVSADIKKFLAEKPPQYYDVIRQTPTGPVNQKVQLPQIIAELTDTIKISNDIQRYMIALLQQVGQVTEALKIEVEESRKSAKKKKRKIIEVDDDEEDEE